MELLTIVSAICALNFNLKDVNEGAPILREIQQTQIACQAKLLDCADGEVTDLMIRNRENGYPLTLPELERIAVRLCVAREFKNSAIDSELEFLTQVPAWSNEGVLN